MAILPVAAKPSSEAPVPRIYVPYTEKHKWPKGFGSLCPTHMPTSAPQDLLKSAIAVEGVGANKLWAAKGNWCFCAHPSPHAGSDAWHGFPVIGGEVDERVLDQLVQAGMITERERKTIRKQKELPTSWP